MFSKNHLTAARDGSALALWGLKIVSPDLAKVNTVNTLLHTHVNSHTQKALIAGNVAGGNTGGYIAIIKFRIPVARKWVLISGHKTLDLFSIDSDAGVHAAIPIVIMLNQIEKFVAAGRYDRDL